MDESIGTEASEVKSKVEEEISLISLLGILVRYRRLILSITGGSIICVLFFAIGSLILPSSVSYLPNVYTPRAIILVSEDSGGGIAGALASSGLGGLASLAGVSVGGSSKGELVVFIAKSNSTLDELNSEFDFTTRYKVKKSIKAETRSAILEHYSVFYNEDTMTVSIAFEDTDPEFAAAVVNQTVGILDRRFAALSGSRAIGQKRLLESKLLDVNVELERIQTLVSEFTARYGVLNVEALATEQVTILARLRSEMIMKDMEIENYERFSKVDDPVIRRLKAERDSIEEKIAELESGRSGVMPGQKDIPAIAFEYAKLQRDLLVQGEILKLLTQQYELAKLDAEGQGPSFQVLELAEPPDKKSGPSRAMLCVGVTLAGFFLSVLLVFILEAVKNIRRDPEAMAKLRGTKA